MTDTSGTGEAIEDSHAKSTRTRQLRQQKSSILLQRYGRLCQAASPSRASLPMTADRLLRLALPDLTGRQREETERILRQAGALEDTPDGILLYHGMDGHVIAAARRSVPGYEAGRFDGNETFLTRTTRLRLLLTGATVTVEAAGDSDRCLIEAEGDATDSNGKPRKEKASALLPPLAASQHLAGSGECGSIAIEGEGVRINKTTVPYATAGELILSRRFARQAGHLIPLLGRIEVEKELDKHSLKEGGDGKRIRILTAEQLREAMREPGIMEADRLERQFRKRFDTGFKTK